MTMMFNVVLKTKEDVKDFVYTASDLPSKISVKVMSKGKTVNGRNLLAMLSISAACNPLSVVINYKNEKDCDGIRNKFYPWIITSKERDPNA